MEKICKNCKWWIFDTDGQFSGGNFYKKGECHSPQLWVSDEEHLEAASKRQEEYDNDEKTFFERASDDMVREAMAAACDASGMASFYTSENFGCNLWEPKSSEN
jgi:hypothetical protein